MADAQGKRQNYIRPPNPLLSRVGPIEFDEAAIKAAEQIVADMVTENRDMIKDEVDKLGLAWEAVGTEFLPETVKSCFALAHDLAGYGETFGYPLITTLSRSLCRFMKLDDKVLPLTSEVIAAHIAALRVVATQRITGEGGDVGRELVKELDKAIVKFNGRSGQKPAQK